MNIWIFNHYAHPPDLPGSTRHFDLGRELVTRGHKVVIFASSFRHYLYRETRLKENEKWKFENVEGVQFIWLRTFPYQRNDWRRVINMLSYALVAWRIGRKLPKLVSHIGKPDVVIGSSVHLLAVLAAYWLAKYYDAKFIMEVRDLWPQTIVDLGEMSKKNLIIKLLQMLEHFLYQKAEWIITLLPLAHEYISSHGIPHEKIIWIPNGVDLSRFEDIRPKSLSSIFKVMYVGAHGKANALDVILQAAKLVQNKGLSEIKFILIGDGPEKPRLIEWARRLDLKNVEFRDAVQKSDIPKILKEANAFIFNLEKAEVFKYGISSNKLFDYMAAGRPIIFSVKAANNPIEESRCGFTVPPRDPLALANAVIELYRMSSEEREAMGHRAKEYVKKYHSICKLTDRLESCLKTLSK